MSDSEVEIYISIPIKMWRFDFYDWVNDKILCKQHNLEAEVSSISAFPPRTIVRYEKTEKKFCHYRGKIFFLFRN